MDVLENNGQDTSLALSDEQVPEMCKWVLAVTTLMLSAVSGQFGDILNGFTGTITKEVAAIKDPIDKTATFIGFSQCKHVKKILGMDYDQFSEEPDMTQLTLDFITREIKIKFNLTALSDITASKWFQPENGLIIYLHGFTDNPAKDSYTNINQAFLSQGNVNILALDSSSLIRWFYLRSSTMVRFIGQTLAVAISIMTKSGLDPSTVHLIGHSLGSHIAGFTGKAFYNLTGTKLGRISGLDPAGPCFADVDLNLRLNKNDAEFVVVIHSDAGVYGLNEVCGHVDYHPNSGSEQRGCLLQTCSHSRAWWYFSESVTNPTGFPALSCDSWKSFKNGDCDNNTITYMGFATKPGTTGQYYLRTNDKPPYALGMEGIKHDNKDGVVRGIRDYVGLWRR